MALTKTDQEAWDWLMSIERIDPEKSIIFDSVDISQQIQIWGTVPAQVGDKSFGAS